MLLPFAKIFSLCLRLFTRPTINLAKSALKGKSDHPPVLQDFFVQTGHFYHVSYMRLQRSFLSTASHSPIKPLSEEKALEAGVEFTCEAMVYGVLSAWGIYELRKVVLDTRRKEERQNGVLSDLTKNAEEIEQMQTELETKVDSMVAEIRKDLLDIPPKS